MHVQCNISNIVNYLTIYLNINFSGEKIISPYQRMIKSPKAGDDFPNEVDDNFPTLEIISG